MFRCFLADTLKDPTWIFQYPAMPKMAIFNTLRPLTFDALDSRDSTRW